MARLKYGAGNCPADKLPIGGGAGYGNILTKGDYTAEDLQSFLEYIPKCANGKVLWIPKEVAINHSALYYTSLPYGITIASDAGLNGSLGGMIFNDDMTVRYLPSMVVNGSNVKFSGLRLRGPDQNIGSNGQVPLCHGIEIGNYKYFEIENCELYGHPYAGYLLYPNGVPNFDEPGRAWIHHSRFHHNRRSGLGYGGQESGASLLECNVYDYGRHAVDGNRVKTVHCETRWCIFGANFTNTVYARHGGNDSSATVLDSLDGTNWGNPNPPNVNTPAGGRLWVHHCTTLCMTQPFLQVRGIPGGGNSDPEEGWVNAEYNWIKRNVTPGEDSLPFSTRRTILYQRLNNIIGGYVNGYGTITGNPKVDHSWPYIRMDIDRNWYGLDEPTEEEGGTLMVNLTVLLKEKTSGLPVAGATVSIQITKPDSSTDTASVTTDAAGMATAPYSAEPGSYTAQASFAETSKYKAAQSDIVPFGIDKLDVVLTLTVATA